MRSKNSAPITPADAARFEALYGLGCLACRLEREWATMELNDDDCGPTENHHLLWAGKRRGHKFTIPLGRWHHQGVSNGESNAAMLKKYGPSFHKHTRSFRERYGADAELLARVNKLIGEDA